MAVVATGFFDGVHLGHRQVIQTLVSSARERGEEAIVVTFAQHPRAVLQQDARTLRLLNSPQEKEAQLRALGVDRVETLPFDRNFARLTAEEYLRTVLRDRLGATLLILGYDNRLGSDCLTPDRVQPIAEQLGLEIVVVPAAQAASAVAPENRATLGIVRGGTAKRWGPKDVFRPEPTCSDAEQAVVPASFTWSRSFQREEARVVARTGRQREEAYCAARSRRKRKQAAQRAPLSGSRSRPRTAASQASWSYSSATSSTPSASA